jgi:hypothetical protein
VIPPRLENAMKWEPRARALLARTRRRRDQRSPARVDLRPKPAIVW